MEEFTQDDLQSARAAERRKAYVSPSLFEKVKNRIVPSALGPGTLWANKPIGMDGSNYQPKVNWSALKGRLKFVIWKAAEVPDNWRTSDPENWIQSTHHTALDQCYQNNIPFSSYIYLNTAYFTVNGGTMESWTNMDNESDPVVWAKSVLNSDLNVYITVRSMVIGGGDWRNNPNNLREASYRKTYSLWGDVERWYRSTADWLTNKGNAAKISGVWINSMSHKWAYRLDRLMRHGFIPRIPIGFYSARWFIDQYCPEFDLGTAQNWPVWNAGWYFNPSPSVVTSLEGVKDQFSLIPDSWRPKMWGKDPTDIIQITGDKFKIPEVTNQNGTPVGCDFNVWWNPSVSIEKFLNFQPKPESCPAGTHWDSVKKECVPDVPNPDYEGRITSLESDLRMTKLQLSSLEEKVKSAGKALS